ncbi:MAG: AraC family transcriptional regulator [Oscillospiraceae bacterium]
MTFKKNRGKSYYYWMRSYLIFALVFIIALIIIFVQAQYVIKREIIKANTLATTTIHNVFETTLDHVESLAISISQNESVTRYVQAQPQNAQNAWNLHSVINTLNEYNSIYASTAKFSIYFNRTETIVLTYTAGNINNHYQDYLLKGMDNNAEAWKDFYDRKHAREILPSQNGNFVYVQTFYTHGYDSMPSFTVIAEIEDKIIQDTLKNDNIRSDGGWVMFNKNNEPIYATKYEKEAMELQNNKTEITSGNSSFTFNGTKFITSTIHNDSDHLKYMYMLPESKLWFGVGYWIWYSSVIFVSIILFALFFMMYFSKKFYLPITEIMDMIIDSEHINNKGNIDKNLDEYKYIKSVLSNKYSKLERIVNEKDMEVFRRKIVGYLNNTTKLPLAEILKSSTWKYDFPKYIICIITIDEVKDTFYDMDYQNEDELIQYAIINILNEVAENRGEINTVNIGKNEIFCLIALPDVPDDEIYKKIKEIFSKSVNLTLDNLSIYYSAYFGNIFTDINDLRVQYKHVQDICFNNIKGEDIVFYKDINWYGKDYNYNIDVEEKLLYSLKNKDNQKAKEIIEDSLKIFETPLVDFQNMFTLIRTELIGACLKALPDKSKLKELKIDKIFEIKDHIDLKVSLYTLIDEICELIVDEPEDQNVNTVNNIRTYILENYSNENLNVGFLGEIFNLSPNYLSRIFSIQTGEVLRDFITNTRVDAAKRFLQNDAFKVVDVSNKCGFLDTSSFIRVFKKSTGITPGQYKKMSKK